MLTSIRRANASAALLMLTALVVANPVHAQLNVQNLPDFTTLVEAAAPAVVNISTTQRAQVNQAPEGGEERRLPQLPPGMELPDLPEDSQIYDLFRRFFGEREGPQGPGQPPQGRDGQSLGSGFIVSKDGFIITNNHVVAGADEVIVRLNDRRQYIAEVIGTDERSDIAVLKVEATDLPTVPLGRDYDLKVGEWVLAIGAPFGFDFSVTAGIVSAKGRSLPSESYVPFIQTDVAINPGNSGGPLFNLAGEVVGVNAQIFSRTGGFMGLSFAIPIDVAMDVADQLRDNGRVSRGWLGVLIQDVTRELAESFDMDKPEGALVARVLDGSPAAKAGFEVGDIVLAFNGRGVASSSDLPPIVGRTRVGREVPVDILRNGKSMELTVMTAELPDEKDIRVATAAPGAGRIGSLGIRVEDLDDAQREALNVDEGGVLVAEVGDGPAAKAGVRKGDVVLMLDNERVGDAAGFASAARKLPSGKAVSILIQRDGNPLFLALKAR